MIYLQKVIIPSVFRSSLTKNNFYINFIIFKIIPVSFDGARVSGKLSFMISEEWNTTSSVGGHEKIQLLLVITACPSLHWYGVPSDVSNNCFIFNNDAHLRTLKIDYISKAIIG